MGCMPEPDWTRVSINKGYPIEAANAFLPSFVANYNGRFAKLPARDKDLHRLLDPRQDLDEVLCWREQRQVSHQLVVNYSRMKLTLKPDGIAVRLRGKMVDIYDFPDGRLEVRWKGRSLPYSAFDKLQRVSHAAIVENKRLGEILAWIRVLTPFRRGHGAQARHPDS